MRYNTSKIFTRRMFRMLLCAAFIILQTSLFVSCSEKDNSVEEFANWQEVNENYFSNLYTQAQQKIASNDTSWKIIRQWSLEESVATRPVNHIIVHVLEEGKGTECPMFTDSVRVHYSGKLIPSATFTTGYVFDKSYYGNYDKDSSRPATFKCSSSLVDGFATALMNMHVGDRWEVYIPYQLGYGAIGTTNSSGATSIPGYSTLIFDITMVSFYRANETPPTFQAKENHVWIEE